MNNKELQDYLAQYPDELSVQLKLNCNDIHADIIDFEKENIMLTPETSYIDSEAPEDQHDTEDGKLEFWKRTTILITEPDDYITQTQ